MSPGSRSMPSILILSSAATRYCLPPVLMTANIVLVLVFDPGARKNPDRLLSVGCWVSVTARMAIQGCNKARGPWGPRTGWLWLSEAELSRNAGLNRPSAAGIDLVFGLTGRSLPDFCLDQPGQVAGVGFRHPHQHAKALQPAEE